MSHIVATFLLEGSKTRPSDYCHMATSFVHSGWLPKWSNDISGSVLRLSRLVILNALNTMPGAHSYVQHSVDSASTVRVFAEILEYEVRIRDMAARRGLTKLPSYSGTLVRVLCYKSEGRGFDPSWCHWNFSLT